MAGNFFKKKKKIFKKSIDILTHMRYNIVTNKEEKEITKMMTVELFGTEEIVEINENEITTYETSCGDVYEEACQLDDGRWVAYDEAICDWVMLG